MAWMTLVIGVLYCVGFVSQLTTVASLSMPSEIRTKLGFHALTRPETMVSSVLSGVVIQSVLSYPQRKMSSMFTPRPIHGVPLPPPVET